MNKKKPTKKVHRVVLTLSDRDFHKLDAYAKQSGTSRPMAAKRLLRQQLTTVASTHQQAVSENQLGLFDSMQIDIFDCTSKTVD